MGEVFFLLLCMYDSRIVCYQELEEARAAHIEIQERIESKQRQTLQSSPEVNGATQRIEVQKVEVCHQPNLESQITKPTISVFFMIYFTSHICA